MKDKMPSVLVKQSPPKAETIDKVDLNDVPDLVQSSSSEDSEYDDSDEDDNDGFGLAVEELGGVRFYSLNSLLSPP
jgi:hypothetical protein